MRISLLILSASIWVTGCNSKEDCGPNPGCPPPFLNQQIIYFQFINNANDVIDLTESNVKDISWTIKGSEITQYLAFDTGQDVGFVFLREQNSILENVDYVIVSSLGEAQAVNVSLNSKNLFQDECNPCIQYFISSIYQNEDVEIFNGELTNEEIIGIEIN